MLEVKLIFKKKPAYLKDESGATAVMILLLFIAFIGIAGFAVDIAKYNYVKQQTDNALDVSVTTMAAELTENPRATSSLLDTGVEYYIKNVEDIPYLTTDPVDVPSGSQYRHSGNETIVVSQFYTSTITRQGGVSINQPSVTMAVYSCSPSIFINFLGVDDFCFTSESTGRLTQSEH